MKYQIENLLKLIEEMRGFLDRHKARAVHAIHDDSHVQQEDSGMY